MDIKMNIMNIPTQFAEQQLLGFFHAKRGYSLIELISNMGLTKKEWDEINDKHIYRITVQEEKEIMEYFNKISV